MAPYVFRKQRSQIESNDAKCTNKPTINFQLTENAENDFSLLVFFFVVLSGFDAETLWNIYCTVSSPCFNDIRFTLAG